MPSSRREPLSPPSGHPGLPDRWPSAWPSLWPGVRDSVAVVALTMVLTLVGVFRFGDPALSWWVALLPLLLLIGPLTRPARVRRTIRRATEQRTLRVRQSGDTLWISAGRRRVGARVDPDGAVTYRARASR